MKKIIMRADDLGYSEAVNIGIYKSIHDGLIRNVGLMSNMEFAEQGYRFIQNEHVCLGLHVNISAGKPICDPRQVLSLVDHEGHFRKSKDYLNSKKDISIEEAIMEIEGQYLRFIEITGRKPAYMDGHAVSSFNFFKALEIVSQKYQILYISFPISITEPIEINHSKVLLNGGSDNQITPFECLKRVVEKKDDHIEMIIYHPGFLDAYIMKNSSLNIQRVFELEMLCDSEVKEYLSKQNVELITFNDL